MRNHPAGIRPAGRVAVAALVLSPCVLLMCGCGASPVAPSPSSQVDAASSFAVSAGLPRTVMPAATVFPTPPDDAEPIAAPAATAAATVIVNVDGGDATVVRNQPRSRNVGGSAGVVDVSPPAEPAPDGIIPLGQGPGLLIPTVWVRNAGNPPRIGGGGGVGYEFEIARYETTNADYATFLSAVAAFSDANGLYANDMSEGADGGIVRVRRNRRFYYQVRDHMADKPVNYVSWFNAARFANWMTNGRPVGEQGPGTTETGSYDLTIGDAFYLSGTRGPDADWVLPNADEFIKAAFYDPSRAVNRGYWGFATRNEIWPAASPATDEGLLAMPGLNIVNYDRAANWNGSIDGNVVSIGAAGPQAASYYGAFDLNGNVAEWTEELICVGGLCGRNIRGGSFLADRPDTPNMVNGLQINAAPIYGMGGERHADGHTGFRLARLRAPGSAQ